MLALTACEMDVPPEELLLDSDMAYVEGQDGGRWVWDGEKWTWSWGQGPSTGIGGWEGQCGQTMLMNMFSNVCGLGMTDEILEEIQSTCRDIGPGTHPNTIRRRIQELMNEVCEGGNASVQPAGENPLGELANNLPAGVLISYDNTLTSMHWVTVTRIFNDGGVWKVCFNHWGGNECITAEDFLGRWGFTECRIVVQGTLRLFRCQPYVYVTMTPPPPPPRLPPPEQPHFFPIPERPRPDWLPWGEAPLDPYVEPPVVEPLPEWLPEFEPLPEVEPLPAFEPLPEIERLPPVEETYPPIDRTSPFPAGNY